jgi:multidrug efflux pump subunit AcrA (membrane-fusion protein)
MRRVTFEKSGLAYLLISIGALAGCSSASEEAPPPATPVRVAEAAEGPAAPTIRTNGMLANEDEFQLSFKVGGVIESISVSAGDRVRRGQKLAEIEQTEIDAQVEQARQAHAKAQRDVERGERLYADQVISLEQLQDLRTQSAVTEAALQAAQFNRSYAAIVEGQGDRASVFVLENGHARRRGVNVAFIEADRVALLDGVRAGEQVITDGALYLEDGEAVSVQKEAVTGS